jgi:GDSL-like lipase/acylhydrolase family protein
MSVVSRELAEPARSGRRKLRKTVFRLSAFLLAGATALGLGEGVLRIVRERDRFYPYVPRTVTVAYPTPEIAPGVEGPSTFTVNSFGCRGPEPAGERIRMLTVGGSTTACTILDDAETWPATTMTTVNARIGPETLWVTNSGIDGKRTCHHVAHLRHLAPKIPNLDVVLVYCGLNDVGAWLYVNDYAFGRMDDVDGYANAVGEAFRISDYDPPGLPWYKRTEIWKAAVVAKARYRTRKRMSAHDSGFILEDDRLAWLQSMQEHRQSAEKILVPRAKMDTFPRLLQEYGQNLRTMARLAHESGYRLIFMSQAILWQGLSEEQKKHVWMGAMDQGQAFIREDQMEELVRGANATMQEVAASEQVLFLDLAARIAGHPEYFHDGCHFNELGAREVGTVVADFVIANVVVGAGGRGR